GGGEGCGYDASLGKRKHVAHISTAETETTKESGLSLFEKEEREGLHLNSHGPRSRQWGPLHIVIFLKIFFRQINDGIGYMIALDGARFGCLRLVDLAAPAKPHACAVSQRRFRCDHEPSRH